MSFNNGPTIVTNGLVLALDAGDRNSYPGSGTTWRDLSGNNNNGTLTNGPTFSSANLGSIVFDGVNDYINISNNSILFPQIQITLEIVVKCTPVTSGRLLSTELDDYTTPYLLYFSNNKPTFFLSNNSPNSFVDLQSTISVNNSSYYHIIATYDSSFAKIYINGSFNTQAAYTNTIYNPGGSGYVYLMASNYRSTLQFFQPGNLPVARIYNRALSATEILQNYNATKTRFGL